MLWPQTGNSSIEVNGRCMEYLNVKTQHIYVMCFLILKHLILFFQMIDRSNKTVTKQGRQPNIVAVSRKESVVNVISEVCAIIFWRHFTNRSQTT